jgi:protoporphyrinogen oxidase
MRDFMPKSMHFIIGAGLAGLTAAYELLTKTNINLLL